MSDTDDLVKRLRYLSDYPGTAPRQAADRIKADAARIAELEAALASCEAWIVDGGHVDDDDARNGATGARLVYEQARAALGEKKDG